MPTHKKKVNRDKYYALAKEQGYRSRAAFKLIQINKKHDFLSKAKVCIDLCAAPGGWCQVAAKTMPANSIVLGIDLLPIRPIRNVKTFVSDITTAECRGMIKHELQTWSADVVLCDGAPNVGAAYVKDAFVQNELALAALKFATDHLGKGGTFCTKVYRSQDYNALVWVFKQLFEDVHAIKPSSSRSVSAEIFLLCLRYRCPSSLDPRLLDPTHVFRQDYGGADNPAPSIFHKGYDAQKRHRTGYDSTLGPTLRKSRSIVEFVDCSDPAQFLADCNEISFDATESSDIVRLYVEHSTTTPEIKACCKDLKLLNKGDFKELLKWRIGLREFQKELTKVSQRMSEEDADDEVDGVGNGNRDSDDDDNGSESEGAGLKARDLESEVTIQEEIAARQHEIRMRMRREKKKLRREAAKLRQRKALGMDHNSFEVPEDSTVFSLTALKSKAHLDRAAKVSLDKVALGIFDVDEEEDGATILSRRRHRGVERDGDDDSDESGSDDDFRIAAEVESMLDESYTSYLKRRKGALAGTKTAKRAKKATARKAALMASEDAEEWDGDQEAYVKLLTESRGDDSDSSSDESSRDGETNGLAWNASTKSKGGHPLLVDVQQDNVAPSEQVARWFSDPIFGSVRRETGESDDSDENGEEIDENRFASKSEGTASPVAVGEQVEMPLTDKDIRKLRRKKEQERKSRNEERKKRRLGQQGLEFVVQENPDPFAAQTKEGDDGSDHNSDEIMDGLEDLSPERREKMLEVRSKIAAGVGIVSGRRNKGDDGSIVEIVPVNSSVSSPISKKEGKHLVTMPARVDDRVYDSEHEEYDTDDDITTLAIGTLMHRPSRAKKLVDASYNRYTWNDPSDLPEWFTDDETKHYRPQLPVPKPLMDQIKQRFEDLTSKPIKKVVEARARKRKRAAVKLKAAKKKAEALVNDEHMSEKEKLKAIGKAMNSATKNSSEASHHSKKLIVMTKAHKGKVSVKKGSKLLFITKIFASLFTHF